jgi:Na+/H+-dicarboxylate symporter
MLLEIIFYVSTETDTIISNRQEGSRMKHANLTVRILVGMIAGFVVGCILNIIQPGPFVQVFLVDGLFHIVGQIFLASLKLLVVPLVFVSLVCGTASMNDIKKLGKIGGKTLGLYLLTTCIAVSLALLGAILIQPGVGFNLTTELSYQGTQAPSLVQTIINIFPTNPVKAMTEGNMLQVIVFSILMGLGIALVGEKARPVQAFFESANEIILKIVLMLMQLAPYGVFALLAGVFAKQGMGAVLPLAKYFFLVVGILILHAIITYPLLLKTLSGLSPIQFFRKYKAPMAFAFSTSSSNATLPITLETVEHRLGVKNSIASFTIPLGATLNMDGTAIMQGVATGFIAQAFGIDLSVTDYLMVVVTATLASIGTAGVPGVGLIMLAMVLRQVNLPVEGIGLIIGVDRLLDMLRTVVNVIGDGTVTCIVAKSENQFDKEVFEAKLPASN